MFFFGVTYNDKGEVVLGNGNDNNHFNLCFTSAKLLERLKLGDTYHIDCTYKIVKYFFPVLVFGITDIDRVFQPIAFMITSHETRNDFEFFFTSLASIASDFDIVFNPKIIISDACHAMNNAIVKLYPECILLMCWFHLKLNIRKHKNLIPEIMYRKVLATIDAMHNTKSQEEFDTLVNLHVPKWLTMPHLENFGKYFQAQWLDSVFNKWQLFHRKIGFAATNSPIESYNNRIKTDFTKRQHFNIVPALRVFRKLIKFESKKASEFNTEALVKPKIEKEATKLIRDRLLKVDVCLVKLSLW